MIDSSGLPNNCWKSVITSDLTALDFLANLMKFLSILETAKDLEVDQPQLDDCEV